MIKHVYNICIVSILVDTTLCNKNPNLEFPHYITDKYMVCVQWYLHLQFSTCYHPLCRGMSPTLYVNHFLFIIVRTERCEFWSIQTSMWTMQNVLLHLVTKSEVPQINIISNISIHSLTFMRYLSWSISHITLNIDRISTQN